MDLWVRSQGKEKLGKICLIEYSKDDYGYHLFGWHDKFDGHSLGTYKSKERALEVLDDIQNKLLKSKYDKASEDYGKHSDYKDTLIEISSSNYVYEMPEE